MCGTSPEDGPSPSLIKASQPVIIQLLMVGTKAVFACIRTEKALSLYQMSAYKVLDMRSGAGARRFAFRRPAKAPRRLGRNGKTPLMRMIIRN